jgi:protein required for attachment to host cells
MTALWRILLTPGCLHEAAVASPLLLDSDQCARSRPLGKLGRRSNSGRCGIMAKITSKTWALVLNGARCRILRGVSGRGEDVPAELVLRSESRHLRDIMSDKPGRSFTSGGGGRRSAMEYGSDPMAEDQREFIRQIIALLESHRRAGDFDKLAIFAEHDMLGQLRQMMPQSLADLVIREVPKNLLHLSAQELAEAVSRGLPDGSGIS